MQTKYIKQILPVSVVLGGLLFASFVSSGLYRFENRTSEEVKGANYQIKVAANNDSVNDVAPNLLPSPSPTFSEQPRAQKKQVIAQASPTPEAKPQQYTDNKTGDSGPSQPIASPTPQISTPSPSHIPQQHSISVSIDSGNSFQLSVEQEKNNCDVLSQALSEGKLSSLNMQYNPSFSSYAVYQINGLGQEGQVWWTYSVNDKNPPLGCSQVQVQNNDQIRWMYVGPR